MAAQRVFPELKGFKARRPPLALFIHRLKANLEKSELIPVGRVENMEELADDFGYKVGNLPSTYLGMPLGGPFKSVDKSKGGLGVKNLGLFNKALLGKWAWRFANEKKALWNQVIRRKYGEERGWRSGETREAYGVGLWKAINKVGQLVTPFFSFEVGDGKNVDLDSRGGKEGSWTPTFNRSFNDWEMKEVGRLLCCLDGKKVRADEEDRVRWVESKDGPKISFFTWEASWGRVLTLNRLQKRGWALANRCFLCQKCGESIDHLLLHCERTREVLLLSFFGVSWVFPLLVKETLISWRGSFVGKKRKVAWLMETVMLILGYLEG
ncbi:hypothetical protein CK203_084438 [Vitis vinifera]|uniref:Reverse transcriptase zinc-binding domain-containing protein n=1 Tax=Vitis vinifera TaxID=29760 RepID=A0A438EN48_VITVI|nr:hypothetical protein CK203_084438 [Vitis vinifera]